MCVCVCVCVCVCMHKDISHSQFRYFFCCCCCNYFALLFFFFGNYLQFTNHSNFFLFLIYINYSGGRRGLGMVGGVRHGFDQLCQVCKLTLWSGMIDLIEKIGGCFSFLFFLFLSSSPFFCLSILLHSYCLFFYYPSSFPLDRTFVS